jgi:hypothetical protein
VVRSRCTDHMLRIAKRRTCTQAHAYLLRFFTSCAEPASKEKRSRSGPAETTSLTASRFPSLLFLGMRIDKSGDSVGDVSRTRSGEREVDVGSENLSQPSCMPDRSTALHRSAVGREE